MCGIFGYIGKKDAVKTCIQGLKQLEYRGYDSAGIAGIQKGEIFFYKEVGKVANLEKKIRLDEVNLDLIIGHTRWATHGEPNHKNAHPHLDEKSTLAIIHNGIIENFDSLRKWLKSHGRVFSSDTDTEVIAQLIAHHYQKDLLKAVHETLKQLQGSFAIALIHKDFPGQIIAASRESPLSIGYDDALSEVLVASDPNAFLGRNLNVLFLRNEEIARLCFSSVEVFDENLKPVKKTSEKFEGAKESPTKEGFAHFMLKEIHEQPLTLQKAMLGCFQEDDISIRWEDFPFSKEELKEVSDIVLIACGTSWHAALLAASLLEEKARIPAKAEIASEFRLKNPLLSKKTLVIAISQSGETADTIAALRLAKACGCKILSFCNVKNSTLVRESHGTLFLQAGPEFSVCSTKAFTSQIMMLSLFVLFFARLRHAIEEKEIKIFFQELKKIPQKVFEVLKQEEKIQKLAYTYSRYEHFFFLGRGYMVATAQEAALKLKEVSYLNASAYPAGEMKHGPIALLSANFPVIAFCDNKTVDKMVGNLMEVKARKAPLLVFAPENLKSLQNVAEDVVFFPATLDEFIPFLAIVVSQLFAYYVAEKLGREIDRPRNLAKSVTVE